jgi:hypothetical protein
VFPVRAANRAILPVLWRDPENVSKGDYREVLEHCARSQREGRNTRFSRRSGSGYVPPALELPERAIERSSPTQHSLVSIPHHKAPIWNLNIGCRAMFLRSRL